MRNNNVTKQQSLLTTQMNYHGPKQPMYQTKRGNAASTNPTNGTYSSRHINQPDSIQKALVGSQNKLPPPQQSGNGYLSMKRVNHVVMSSMLNAATNGSGVDLAEANAQQK